VNYLTDLSSACCFNFDSICCGIGGQICTREHIFIEYVREVMLSQNATAIVTVEGDEAVMCDAIVEKGIPVVSFDFGGGNCVSDHLPTIQSDDSMARLVLDEVVKRHANDSAAPPKVGYITDLNFRPLVNHNKVPPGKSIRQPMGRSIYN
jgi:hypothetical protein